MVIEGLLIGLTVNFISSVTKKAAKEIKNLFSDDEWHSVLDGAFKDFQESCNRGDKKKDEKKLTSVFKTFFADDRTINEFRLVFAGNTEQVNFDLMQEIFVEICLYNKIEAKDFHFFDAMYNVIQNIENMANKKPAFATLFQAVNLERLTKMQQKRGEVSNFSFARQKYLQQLSHHNNKLQFEGIPDLKEKKEITLPGVFVMQRMRESVDEKDYQMLMKEREASRHEYGREEFSGEELHMKNLILRQKGVEKEPEKFDKIFAESDNPHFVILGKPGSGKSTLLKFMLLNSAREQLENHRLSDEILFPILVEIRKLENALSKSTQSDYNILDFLYDSMRRQYNLTLPKNFFEQYLESGWAMIMFDGLDEVAAESRRIEIRKIISTFVTGYNHKNAVIITSRISGYSRAQFSTTDYRHFILEDFNEEETDEFIEKWYHSRLNNPQAAVEKANDLKTSIKKKPRIRELAKNPLLVTIIAIIHRYEAQLPEDRLILYDKATEALLYTWDNVKEIIDKQFKLEDKRRFLEKVAFHLQSMEKGDEAGTLIDRNEVYKILLEDFCRIFFCDKRQARQLVKEFIDAVRLRAGLLIELAHDKFGFSHKTFQEYFAAKWIAEEAMVNFDLQIMIDYVEVFMGNAFWQETLLLAIRALPNKQAMKVLEHILNHDPTGIEPYFYHRHYFVMKFLGEQGSWLENREFLEKQVDDFFAFSWNNGEDRSPFGRKTWNRFEEWLVEVSDTRVFSIIVEKLLSLTEDEEQEDEMRNYCASALCHIGEKDKSVVERLLALMEDEKQDIDLRIQLAYDLRITNVKDNAVVERLLTLVEDEEQEDLLRDSCAEAVGRLGVKDNRVIERLLALAADEKLDGYLRRSCAEAVGHLGEKEKAVDILLTLVEDEKQDVDNRSSCATALGDVGVKDKRVAECLLTLVEDEKQDDFLKFHCTDALESLGVDDKDLVGRLLALAEDKKEGILRRRDCAIAVGSLGMKEKAIDILLAFAEDDKLGFQRGICARAVGRLGVKNYRVVERLLALAEDEKQEAGLRCYYVYAVGLLGVKDKALMERLLSIAEDENQADDLRRECASAVGSLGMKEKAAKILIELYQKEEDKTTDEAKKIYDSLWDVTSI